MKFNNSEEWLRSKIGPDGDGYITAGVPKTDFKMVLEGTVLLHELIHKEGDDSEKTDKVRDLLDAPWYKLNDAEKECVQEFSAYLYEFFGAQE